MKKGIKTVKKIYKYFCFYMKNYLKFFLLLIFLSSLSKILTLVTPYINGKIIDFITGKEFNKIISLLIIIFFISILNGIISLFESHLNVYLSNTIIVDIKEKLMKKIVCLKLNDFNQKTVGEYFERLEGDTNTISSFFIKSIPTLVLSVITLIISGFFSFYISFFMTAIGMISFPIALITNYYFGKKVKSAYELVRDAADDYTSMVQQILNGEKTIKGLHVEKEILKKYFLKINILKKLNIKSGLISATGGLVQLISSTLFELILIFLACYFIISDKISIGSYVSFNVYLSSFLLALRTIAATNLNLQTVFVSMERIETITSFKPSEDLTQSLISLSGEEISIKNLDFSFSNGNKIFDKFTVSFYSNEITAVVGTSGCGKTTLLNIISRFYDFFSGEILIDNKNINEIPLNDLRNAISYVQQSPFLFKDTIKNNLLLANPMSTDAEIVEACKRAYIYETIIKLPDGFNTLVGEFGYNLSGGQKQRLAIARGILKNSKIFLFDEITSDLDGESEKYILEALYNLAKGHMVIIVAHRLTTAINIPRIIVIDKGIKISEGNHRELIQTCDVYQRLFCDKEV